jgi:TonB-linked SusC/RagA family outer membrane protein
MNFRIIAPAPACPVFNQFMRIMKFTTFLMTAAFLQVSATGISQITLKEKNASLEKIVKEIKKQTNYVFLISEESLQVDSISIEVKNASLEETLRKCFEGRPLDFSIRKNNVLIKHRPVSPVANQNINLTGRVLDEKGHPIQSATVSIKNTGRTALTNNEGEFVLSDVDDNAVLVVTFVGYASQEIPLAGRKEIIITMQPENKALEDVVVVGMNNRQTKRSVTGAIASIQSKELKQSPVANLSNALAGRLPGLVTVQTSGVPGSDQSNLYIRGISTYGSNTAPLIVIDGLPRSAEDFTQVDPNEIATVTILKDAASASLYGIQGANGVIVVTTKRGGANEKPAIDFTAQYAMQKPTRLPRPMSGYEMAMFENEYALNSGLPQKYSADAIEIMKGKTDPFLYPDVNWFDEILEKNSKQNQYNLNISGTTNSVRYFVSGSYIRQGTLLKEQDIFYDNYDINTKFDRYNFRSNIDLDATKMLHLQIDLAGRLEERVEPGHGFDYIFSDISARKPGAMPVFNPDGSLGAGSAVEIPYRQNPYGLITQAGYYSSSINAMYGTISARHDLDFITPGLSVQGFFNFKNNNENYFARVQNFDSYWYRGKDGTGAPIYQQQTIASKLTTTGDNRLVEKANYLDARINYKRSFKEHALTAQILFNRSLRTFNTELPYAYQGISSRFSYSFRSRYFIEFNGGYNGSENFPPDKRYGFFPAVSAAWVISDESFLKENRLVNYLKVRGSYGIAGNDRIGGDRFLYISDFVGGGGYNFGVNPQFRGGYLENRVGNEFVTWERSRKSNLGFDLSILSGDMLQFVFDVFKEKRTNVLTAPGTVNQYAGISNLSPRNSGIVENQGFEVEVKFNKRVDHFTIFATAQLSYNRNKVIENDQAPPAMAYQNLRSYPIGYTLGYISAGFFRDEHDVNNSPKQMFSNKVVPGDIKYVDINGDGVINSFDRVPIETKMVPPYTGGFSVGVSYRSIDISTLFSGAFGEKGIFIGVPERSIINLQRWTPATHATALIPIPHLTENNRVVSTFWHQKTDYLKLRNAEIGYTIPEKLLKTIKLKHARIYVNGQNLVVWDKLALKEKDPETNGDYFNLPYPIQKIINIGINVRL